MPYIKESARVRLSHMLDYDTYPADAGELNYIITTIVQKYFQHNGGRYQQINDVVGALEGAKLEFYARVVRPYEDSKILENGDVMSIRKYNRDAFYEDKIK